jgi:hypothetical protein
MVIDVAPGIAPGTWNAVVYVQCGIIENGNAFFDWMLRFPFVSVFLVPETFAYSFRW